MKKDNKPASIINLKDRRLPLVAISCLVLTLVILGTSKVIYVNLHNAYGTLYNPVPDILILIASSVFLGLVLSRIFQKSK